MKIILYPLYLLASISGHIAGIAIMLHRDVMEYINKYDETLQSIRIK